MAAAGGKKEGCKERRKNSRMRTLPNKGMTRSCLSNEECFGQRNSPSRDRVVCGSLLCTTSPAPMKLVIGREYNSWQGRP